MYYHLLDLSRNIVMGLALDLEGPLGSGVAAGMAPSWK